MCHYISFIPMAISISIGISIDMSIDIPMCIPKGVLAHPTRSSIYHIPSCISILHLGISIYRYTYGYLGTPMGICLCMVYMYL